MLQILNDDCFYRTKKGKFNLELCKQYENKSNIKCIDFNRDNNSKQTNNISHKYTHSHIKYNNIYNHIMFFACTRVLIEYFSHFFMKIEEKKTSINFYKINHLLKWDEKKWLEILYSKKEHVYTIHTYDKIWSMKFEWFLVAFQFTKAKKHLFESNSQYHNHSNLL